MNGYPGTYELIDPRKIVVDHRYQRQPKNTLIQQIAQNPSWLAFGVPVCFRRENGMYYVIDGQQRIAGLLKSEKPPKLIPVVWFPIDDVKDEAEIFVRMNETRKALQPIEKHRGKIMAGNEAALAVERAVATAGYSIDAAGAGGVDAKSISAVSRIGQIYNRIGEEGLVQTLVCIRDAWPNDPTGVTTHILNGVAELIEEQGESYNRAVLIRAMKKSTPGDLLRKSKELSFDFGGSKMANVRRAFASECGLKMPRATMPKATA